jgi:PAS domain S-box-containing protein
MVFRTRVDEGEGAFRALAESTSSAIFVYQGSRFRYVNPASEQITGYSRVELLGLNFWDLVHSEDRTMVRERGLARQRNEQVPNRYEFRLLRKDGETRWIDFTGATITFEGEPAALGTATDITERKHTEEQLRGSEERFRRVVEHISDGLIVDDAAGNVIFANDRFLKLFGLASDDIAGLRLEDYVAPEYRSELRDRHERRVRGEDVPSHFEYEGLGRNGRRLWLEVDVVPVKEANVIVGTQSAIREITTRKRTEEELKRSKETLALAVEATGLGLFDFYPQTGSLVWNEVVKRHFGLSPDAEITYDTFLQGLHPNDRNRVDGIVQQTLRPESGGRFHLEYRTVGIEDGVERWLDARGQVIFDESGNALRFIGATQDVSARKRYEAALIRTEKLATIGTMAATIAHEINNPLSAAINALYLCESSDEAEERGRCLHLAQNELSQIANLVKHTLGFSRRGGRVSTFLFRDVVDSVLTLFAPKIKSKAISVRTRFRNAQTMTAWEGEIRQVVSNLVGNALDALDIGGRLEIRYSGNSGFHRITVADTGSGIARETMRKMFEPFFSTKQDVGTGLGLWVTKQIVQKQGGSIRVRSRVGKGTVFAIVLPHVPEQSTLSIAC